MCFRERHFSQGDIGDIQELSLVVLRLCHFLEELALILAFVLILCSDLVLAAG
jgi:hypothetical protein